MVFCIWCTVGSLRLGKICNLVICTLPNPLSSQRHPSQPVTQPPTHSPRLSFLPVPPSDIPLQLVCLQPCQSFLFTTNLFFCGFQSLFVFQSFGGSCRVPLNTSVQSFLCGIHSVFFIQTKVMGAHKCGLTRLTKRKPFPSNRRLSQFITQGLKGDRGWKKARIETDIVRLIELGVVIEKRNPPVQLVDATAFEMNEQVPGLAVGYVQCFTNLTEQRVGINVHMLTCLFHKGHFGTFVGVAHPRQRVKRHCQHVRDTGRFQLGTMDVSGRNGIAERGPTVGDVVQKRLGEVTGARQNSTIARSTRGCSVVQRFGFRGRDKGQDR